MALVREDVALVDQIVLNNIEILHIADLYNLIKQNIVEISTTPPKYVMADGQEFSQLEITNDIMIDRLYASTMYKGYKKINYCTLALSVKSEIGNLYCYTIIDYKNKLVEIKNHLWNQYGIMISIDNATVKTIEINRTFGLNESFNSYNRVIRVMMQQLPKRLRNHVQIYKTNKNQTYYARNSKSTDRFISIKIYDKTTDLETKHHTNNISVSYMRVEIRVTGSDNIKKSFGSRHLSTITDELLNLFFNKKMVSYFFNPYTEWIKKRNKHLITIIQEQRSIDIRHWQINLLRTLSNEEISNGFATLLDITELFPLLKSKKLNLTPKRQYEIKKNFQRHVKDYEIVFNQKDNEKLNELLAKLGYAN